MDLLYKKEMEEGKCAVVKVSIFVKVSKFGSKNSYEIPKTILFLAKSFPS